MSPNDGKNYVDHRRKKRRELYFYLQVVDAENGAELGRMIDIHEEGFLLMSSDVIPNGSIRKIKLKMPKSLIKAGHKDVQVRCKVMWARPYNAELTQMGLKFINPKTDDQDIIHDLIKLCGMPLPSADDDDLAD